MFGLLFIYDEWWQYQIFIFTIDLMFRDHIINIVVLALLLGSCATVRDREGARRASPYYCRLSHRKTCFFSSSLFYPEKKKKHPRPEHSTGWNWSSSSFFWILLSLLPRGNISVSALSPGGLRRIEREEHRWAAKVSFFSLLLFELKRRERKTWSSSGE